MRLEAKKYLYDIQRAAEEIAEFTTGKQLADYEREPMLRRAVERPSQLSARRYARLAKTDAPLATRISQYERIIAFRNVLIHAYAEVDDCLVWDIVQTDLPLLRQQAADLLREAEEGRK